MLVFALPLLTLSCRSVLYPELKTALKHPAEPSADARPLDPPPPEDLRWVRFVSAHLPAHTRDGRSWEATFGQVDPYAKLVINNREVFRTASASNTLEPTWPGGPQGNIVVRPQDKIRIELWDHGMLRDAPIGVREVGRPTEEHLSARQIRIDFEFGGSITLAFEPAHALLGLGLWYELGNDTCTITRVIERSPAERAGIQKGDRLVQIGGQSVAAMSLESLQSALNAVPLDGVPMVFQRAAGASISVTLREGPSYPTLSSFGNVE